jgi:threonine/homoserine/homoserine lactone efflux protein
VVYWREFLMVAGAHLLAVMSPGPDFALICRNSLAYSRRAGVLAAGGLGLGILVHVAYCIFGVRELMAVSHVILRSLQYAGAAYLVYIGVRSLLARRPAAAHDEAMIRAMPPGHAVRTGFITNVTNPKAMLFFMALFAMISPQTPRMIQMLYGLEMSIATFAWFAFVATVLSAPPIRRRFLGMSVWIERAMGVVLIVLGVKVAVSTI